MDKAWERRKEMTTQEKAASEKEQTTIRLPKELKEEIEKEANKRNVSFNGLVNMLLYDGLIFLHQKQ